ncbi:angiotensin-converting enzyme-like [Pectinophora gossypiella]|nr:angiotensin-converting enzyme-like [Pectinophora gossypiella]XP_049870973.1 angiotensin-converting enzyme-like [Pectinophora gossypiella]
MRATLTLLVIYFHVLLSSGSDNDQRWFVSLVDLVELDYEDHCEQRASAYWDELMGSSKGLSMKLERDKAFGIFGRSQTTDIRSALSSYTYTQEDEILRRKVKLLLQPGDTLLKTEQWIRLVTFGDTAMNKIRFATNYDCGTTTNCTLRELHNSLARQHDEETVRRMKESWEKNLPDLNDYLDNILPLLRNSSNETNFNSVEEYWDFLGEYEGATLKARELWDHIKPLYVKLHKYVTLKLKGPDEVGKPLPVHLLKSLTGDDWSNLIENLLPKHPDIYQKVLANLQLKELGGLKAFKEASKLIQELSFGELEPQIWEESVFNGSCPTILVDWCKPNKVRAVSCKDVSIGNYIDAHEAAMKIKYKQTTALHSNNTYLLREAARYSAVYEAIPGFTSLLALNPHALDRAGLYQLDRFNFNPNHHRLVLQLIVALRDLPKLNYFLAADEWRLKVLMGTIPQSKIATSWSEFRKNFSLIETSNVDILGDSYVLLNKPYIGKFLGVILKYQIYQSFAEELASDESDLVKHVADSNSRITDAMMQGFGVIWPEMVSDLLAKRENGLEYTGLTDYYRLLDEYLDNQLEPSENNEIDDYIEPVIPEPEENEIPAAQEKPEESFNQPQTHENILDNIIETGEESHSKFETSTVAVMEIKNAPGDQKEDESRKEASYSTYWWIGIAVAVAVIVILIAIIARKRHSHRKQLEKQRRDHSRA